MTCRCHTFGITSSEAYPARLRSAPFQPSDCETFAVVVEIGVIEESRRPGEVADRSTLGLEVIVWIGIGFDADRRGVPMKNAMLYNDPGPIQAHKFD